MKIAFLSWTIPYPITSGGKNRTYHLLRYLAERHEVHLHVPSWEQLELDAGFARLFASVKIYRIDFDQWKTQRWERRWLNLPSGVCAFYATPALGAFHEWVRQHAPDLIFVDEAVMAPYAWPHRDIPAILARQKADHRFYWDVFRRTPWGRAKVEALVESLRFRLYERQLWRRFRFGVVVSEDERRLYLAMHPGVKLELIPNGVDVAAFSPRPLPTDGPPTILLNGLMSYFPNVDAATWFVKAVIPTIFEAVPDARVLIVGHDPTDAICQLASGDRVVVTGSVPDMRPYLERSHVVVVPLRVGHGTRLKVLEAFAAGRPVVSTSIGAEGLSVEPGRHLIVEDEAEAFAAGVVRLLQDRPGAESMAREARRLVERSYSWNTIGADLDRFFRRAVSEARTREGSRRTTFVLPEGMRLGGVTAWSARMCRSLAERGRPAALVQHAPDGAPLAIALSPTVLDIRCANQKPPIDSSLCVADLEHFATDYLRALPGTLVPNWSPGTYATCALLSQRSPEDLRVLGFVHTDEPEYYDWLSYYESIVHRFVAVSAEVAQKLRERIPHRSEHVVVRPYAVELPDITRRAGHSPRGRPLRLAYAGRLSERQKRVSDLARLAEMLEAARVDFQLDIVGAGMDEGTLAERLGALPEPARRRVALRGLLPIDAMMEFWLSVDVLLLVSAYEGTSITMLEAMACGCVPLVTQVSGTAAVIRSGTNGFTVPVGDLAGMVTLLKALDEDRARLAALGAEARRTVEAWSCGEYMDWFLGLVEEVWAEAPRTWSAERPLLPPARTAPEVMARAPG